MTIPNLIAVPPSRLAPGHWCHKANRVLDQGDINASYSAALIAMESRIRKPFRLNGWLCTTVSIAHHPELRVEAYRLTEPSIFDGTPITYADRVTANPEAARDSAEGFYHGITVTYGKRAYVMVGTPILIVGNDEPQPVQPSLF